MPQVHEMLNRMSTVIVDSLIAEENVNIVTDQINMRIVKDTPGKTCT